MNRPPSPPSRQNLALHLAAAIACFHLAFELPAFRPLIFLYLFHVIQLSAAPSTRSAFYLGLGAGLGVAAPQLGFFWTLFGPSAIALWLVLAFWVGLFVALAHIARARLRAFPAALLVAALWTGLEYFRSELYYLRFAWLTIGHALGDSWLNSLGGFTAGFLLAALAAGASLFRRRRAILLPASLLLIAATSWQSPPSADAAGRGFVVTGIQMEFPSEPEVEMALHDTLKKHPETDLFVLSEYTFDGPVPPRILAWCRKNGRHLLAGGKKSIDATRYFNTAFVVDPRGEVIFEQAKRVPIQFFQDGEPAPSQRVWSSPWGPVGICLCYDLSYRRVVDELARQGAAALIIPTMDVIDWGRHQHELHARIGPLRAREYHLPVVRVCSSGNSQIIEAGGRVVATAPFAGNNATLSHRILPGLPARRPLDHWLAPACVAVTALFPIGLLIRKLSSRPTA